MKSAQGNAYSPEVKEAARVLHIEGLPSREIKDRLSRRTAGLTYSVDPSERTIDKWRKEWKNQGILAGYSVQAGEEEAVEEAIYRQFLGVARMASKQLVDATLSNTVTVPMIQRINAYLKVIDAVKYQRLLRERAQQGTLTPKDAGGLGAASDMAKPESMLHRMTKDRLNLEAVATKANVAHQST